MCITLLMHKGRMGVWVCGVSVSRVCMVCYSTHHRVMSQARDDYEGFFRAHMTEEEKDANVSALSLYSTITPLIPPSFAHSHTDVLIQLTH